MHVTYEVTVDHQGNCLTVTRRQLDAGAEWENMTVNPSPFDPLQRIGAQCVLALEACWTAQQLPLWDPATAP